MRFSCAQVQLFWSFFFDFKYEVSCFPSGFRKFENDRDGWVHVSERDVKRSGGTHIQLWRLFRLLSNMSLSHLKVCWQRILLCKLHVVSNVWSGGYCPCRSGNKLESAILLGSVLRKGCWWAEARPLFFTWNSQHCSGFTLNTSGIQLTKVICTVCF